MMNVKVVGRHVKVTSAMQDYAKEKAGKLDRFFDRIQSVEVVLDVDSDTTFMVEMVATLVRSVHLVGKSKDEDMYCAIDQAESKLQRRIQKFHDRLRAHRARGRVSRGQPEEARGGEEATYEQVVREMLEEEEG